MYAHGYQTPPPAAARQPSAVASMAPASKPFSAETGEELTELMAFSADIQLQFDDGLLDANSTVLSLFSSVLRGALEAHTAAGKSSEGPSGVWVPMEGLAKDQWLKVAWFVYPSSQPPHIESWGDLELLLQVGSRFDLKPVLQRAEAYLIQHVSELTAASEGSATSVWKFFQLADKACLRDSLPVLAKHAVAIARFECREHTYTTGLSAAALLELVAALA